MALHRLLGIDIGVPAFFEYFADMDRIIDDDAWEIREDWPMDDSWSLWDDRNQPEVYFRPDDIDLVIEGWNKAHG